MAHTFTVPCRREAATVLKTAQQMMADRGFEVSTIGGGEVRGIRAHSLFAGKKTNDMLALVSKLTIRASSGHLSAEAELGTLRKLVVLLVITFVVMESVFLTAGIFVMKDMMIIWISAITLGPWIFLGPGMLFMFRRQALREIETLLKNSVTLDGE